MILGVAQTVEFNGAAYRVAPFIDGPIAGHVFRRVADGAETRVYANPSTGGDSGPDVFIYSGRGDVESDSPVCFIDAEFNAAEGR